MTKYKPEMLIHIYDDEDIDMYETFESAYNWICEGAECGSSIDEEDMAKIEKLYNNKNKTHNDMIEILNISGLRGCKFNVLSEHYVKDEEEENPDIEPDYNAKTAQERSDEQREIYRTLK